MTAKANTQDKTAAAPSSPQDAVALMQAQTLSAIKNGHAATIEAVKKWNEQVAQATAGLPSVPTPELPSDVANALGEPKQIVDSVYDFAAQLLDLNKQFAHQLIDASTPKN